MTTKTETSMRGNIKSQTCMKREEAKYDTVVSRRGNQQNDHIRGRREIFGEEIKLKSKKANLVSDHHQCSIQKENTKSAHRDVGPMLRKDS